jgi:glycerate-2-kinase
VQHHIIGNNSEMIEAVARVARRSGLHILLHSTAVTGEARNAGEQFAGLAKAKATGRHLLRRPACVMAGGEPTVRVTGRGKGGRAQEFAAAAALALDGYPNVWVAAVGTDGTDGPTDVAGAVVSGDTAFRANKLGINLRMALRRHDTYSALKTLGCHIHTGPTGTNVNDLYLLLLL